MKLNIDFLVVSGFVLVILGLIVSFVFPWASNYFLYFGIALVGLIMIAVIYSITKSYQNIWGIGKLNFNLDNFKCKPGDEVKGTIKLELKKPIQVISGSVSLLGKITTGDKHKSETVVFTKEFPLKLEPNYSPGTTEINFAIKIPLDIFTPYYRDARVFGEAGKIINTAEKVLITTPKWSIFVSIKIKESDISLHEEHMILISPDMPSYL